MQKNLEVSVIVVHYGALKEVFECLNALNVIRLNEKKVEFIFVDNDENKVVGKKIKKLYPWLIYVASTQNLGWGGGRNLGREYAKGTYLLSLDSDIILTRDSFKKLIAFIKNNKNAGLVSTKLTNLSGKYTPQATLELTPLRGIFWLTIINKLWPGNPIAQKYLMSDWDRSDIREVEVSQLGVFAIRRKAFDSVGGFDEKLFLYFEENDLAKRLLKKGWKIYYYPLAVAMHLESRGTPKDSGEIKAVFQRSRFHYFRKHYGIIPSLTVELFARISFAHLFLVLIMLIGVFLRFYKVADRFSFGGEMGNELLEMKNYIGSGIPLLGPATSHSWLSFGPLYYWMMIPLLVLSKFNPLLIPYVFAFFGTFLILINYFIVERMLGQKVALLSSFLIAVNYSFVYSTWGARFFSLAILFFYPFFYFFLKALTGDSKSIFWSAFFFGIMLNFHYTPFVLIPPALCLLFLHRGKIGKKFFRNALFGFFITQIPFLLYNLKTGFGMLVKLVAWFGYRVLVTLGLYPGKTDVVVSWNQSFRSVYEFIVNSFVPPVTLYRSVLVVALVPLIYLLYKRREWFSGASKALSYFLAFGIIGLLVHNNPPYHYFLPLYPIPILLTSVILSKIIDERSLRIFGFFFLFIVLLMNMRYYFSASWFYRSRDIIELKNEYVPFNLQLGAATAIISDARGREYSLRRVGPNDQFEENYAQNYKYLLWWKGNEPADDQNLTYTIYEVPGNDSQGLIYTFGGLSVIRSENGKNN